MKPFTFERAQTVPEALSLIGEDGAFLAGGTNLVDHLRLGIREVDALMDIRRLDLTEIAGTESGSVRIGALVRNSDLAAHPLIRQRHPFVAEALLSGTSGQIRNMATTGGNLFQRTRCVYFQDLTTTCNKRELGSVCAALEGLGRYNAVLGTSEACVAVHPSDLCVPLAALDVEVLGEGESGPRRIPFAEFHRLPGDQPRIPPCGPGS
nr:FAD binding domain-containing protein [Deinococcus sp. RM]